MSQNIINDWYAVFHKPVCLLDTAGCFSVIAYADLDVYAKDGSYLIPAGCVDIEPPQVSEGKAARYQRETHTWEIVADYRGKTVYDTQTGAAYIVQDVGDLPDSVTLLAPPSEHHTWNGKVWHLDETTAHELAQQQLQAAQTEKLAALNQAAQQFVLAHAESVPEFEMQSWLLQAAEAKAWAENRDAPTPVLDIIAQNRQVPREALIQAALRKTRAYEQLTASVAGQRQALQTRIQQAQSVDELDAIDIVFVLHEV